MPCAYLVVIGVLWTSCLSVAGRDIIKKIDYPSRGKDRCLLAPGLHSVNG